VKSGFDESVEGTDSVVGIGSGSVFVNVGTDGSGSNARFVC